MTKGVTAVLSNQHADGGYFFLKNKPFKYGHDELNSLSIQGGMFPTWFRTLTLAYLGKVLPGSTVSEINWKFSNTPGIQFWMNEKNHASK